MNDPASRVVGKAVAARNAQAADLSNGSLPPSSAVTGARDGGAAGAGVAQEGGAALTGGPASGGGSASQGTFTSSGAGGGAGLAAGQTSGGGGGLSSAQVGGGAGGESLVAPPRTITNQEQKPSPEPQAQGTPNTSPSNQSPLAQSHLPKAPEAGTTPLPSEHAAKLNSTTAQNPTPQTAPGIQTESARPSGESRETSRSEVSPSSHQERGREQERVTAVAQAQTKELSEQRATERSSEKRQGSDEKSIYFAPSKEEQSGTALKAPKLPDRSEISREGATSETKRAAETGRITGAQEGERPARAASTSSLAAAESPARSESQVRQVPSQAVESTRPASPASSASEQSLARGAKQDAVMSESPSPPRRVEYRSTSQGVAETKEVPPASSRLQSEISPRRDQSPQVTSRRDALAPKVSARESPSRQGTAPVESRSRGAESPASEKSKGLIETVRERFRALTGTKGEAAVSPKETLSPGQKKGATSQAPAAAKEKSKDAGARESPKAKPVPGKDAAGKGEASDRRGKAEGATDPAKAQTKAGTHQTRGSKPAAQSIEEPRSAKSREPARQVTERGEKRAVTTKEPAQAAKSEKTPVGARAPQRAREGARETEGAVVRGREATRAERAATSTSRLSPREGTREGTERKGIDRLRRGEEPRAESLKERKESLPLAEKVKLGTATPVERVTHEVVQFVKGLFGFKDAEISDLQPQTQNLQEQREEGLDASTDTEVIEGQETLEPEDSGEAPDDGLTQGEVFSIRGRVVEFATAQPLDGITIEILGHGSCRTDQQGEYYFENLREGFQYTIVASAGSYDFIPNNVRGIISGNTTHHFFGRLLA